MKIGFYGFGFVGQAVYSCLKEKNAVIYDPLKEFPDKEILKDCNFIFICVPTPTLNGIQNAQLVKEAIEDSLNFGAIPIVKSTCLYEELKQYENKIVFNPEFLNQNNPDNDFFNQSTIILGGRKDFAESVKAMYKSHFSFRFGPEYELTTLKDAIHTKYIHNIYHAYKVLFWNYVQDVTKNQRKIFELYKKACRVPNEMGQICADGKRGFGGACFPKDVVAFHSKNKHDLTAFMCLYNKYLRHDEMGQVA